MAKARNVFLFWFQWKGSCFHTEVFVLLSDFEWDLTNIPEVVLTPEEAERQEAGLRESDGFPSWQAT